MPDRSVPGGFQEQVGLAPLPELPQRASRGRFGQAKGSGDQVRKM